jgi:transcriptional regulator with XRE-family HTH domain
MPPVPKPKRHRTKHYFEEWRVYRELTRERAAERLGWSVSKLGRVENGRTPYNQDDLYNASEIYQTTPSALIEVNPLKEGEVVDLMRLLKNKDSETAIAVLKALPDKSGTQH